MALQERQNAAWAIEGWSRACFGELGDAPAGDATSSAWLAPSTIACDERREPEACVTVAKAYAYGCRVEPNQERARSLFRWSCDNGDLEGCNAYARMSQEPADQRHYAPRIRRLLRERCDAGHTPECVRLAHMTWNGYWGELPSREGTFAVLTPSCDAGDATSCRELARYAGISELPEHQKLARRINESWCSKGNDRFEWACDGVLMDAGRFHARGQSAAEKRSLEIACAGGATAACRALHSVDPAGRSEPGHREVP
jgi:TPR repeat protein